MLLPGFIDMHCHGAMGHELMDASPEGLTAMAQYYAKFGVTGFLPSTWTASHADILRCLDMVKGMMGPIPGGASVLGVHLEGPYINPLRSGAQDTALIRRASRAESLEYLDSGIVRLIALAPEFPENLWLAEECARRGIVASAGHTAATYEEMVVAVRHGIRQVTHCFNAMTALNHRQPGTVGAALTLPEINAEVIADNIHVHPAVIKLLVSAKGPEHVLLVTDSIRGAGLPDGDYPIDRRTITIRNGEVRLPDGTLAGSTLTMNRALKNLVQDTGRPLSELWVASSLNAARAIGIAHRKGSLEINKDADLVLLDPDFQVQMTVVEGTIL
jgi:N-acetylglucosamine-6-phosphate deacetylase